MKRKVILTESDLIKLIERVIKESDKTNIDFEEIIINKTPETSSVQLVDGQKIININYNNYCKIGAYNKENLPNNCIITLTTKDKKSYSCSKDGCQALDKSREVFNEPNDGKTVRVGPVGQALGRPSQKTKISF